MKYFGVFSLVFFIPLITFAQIIITEIMYDLEGSDSGREWIEITNITTDSIDLSTWKFFENGSNHGLVIFFFFSNLSANSSAILADNPSKFLSDWSGFSGVIFDSSFSLKNTGESISIRNPDLSDVDLVNYITDWGAQGDGSSLQKNNGTWLASSPNPGVYTSSSGSSEESSDEETPSGSSGAYIEPVNFPTGTISTRILGERIVLSGADSFFEAESLGVEGEKLENAKHFWNFGDGSIKEGEKVLHNYIYPGEYIIFLDVSSESFTTNEKIYIEVIPSSIFIVESNKGFIKIGNDSKKELNISLWILQVREDFFIIPKNTYIRSGGEITFSNEITNLNGSMKSTRLLYPNGRRAYEFNNSPVAVSVAVATPETSVPTVQEIVKNEAKNPIEEAQLTATAVLNEPLQTSNEGRESFIDKWILALIGIILISIFGVLLMNKDKTVEGFTIIE